jgi:hypothetical protein
LLLAVVELDWGRRRHVSDASGAFLGVLHRHVKESDLLLANFNQPLAVLAACCQRILDSDYLLKELVREADAEWGQIMGERPYFDREGSPHHPADPYTIASIRQKLSEALQQLSVDTPRK